MSIKTIIIDQQLVLSPNISEPYQKIKFVVPDGVAKVGVIANYYRKSNNPRIYISLHDPQNFRGQQMNWVSEGDVNYDLWVASNTSSNGGIPGHIPQGDWFLQLDISNLTDETIFDYQIYVELGLETQKIVAPKPDGRVLNDQPGWHKGELHTHSIESDGGDTIEELFMSAEQCGLDYIAFTDHFTNSSWWRVSQIHQLPKIIWLNSIEITSHHGHANLHGLTDWVDVFVDRDDWSMNDAADTTHKQGGLFCINHAFSSDMGWGDYSFDWSKADLFEIYHCLEGPNNNLQVSMWDTLLQQGYRMIGVAGTDYHGNRFGGQKLGEVFTYIYCEQLSVKGIINGLKRGKVFVSFGPLIEFSIKGCDNVIVEMGDSISVNGTSLELILNIKVEKPSRVFILKNGFYWKSIVIKESLGEMKEFRLVDDNIVNGYYRFEIHNLFDHPKYDGIEWRDFSTIQALSNPIWITKDNASSNCQ